MTDWLIHKYIGIISSRLEKFKRKGPNLYNFRCILCGDSTTSRSKARAYIYEKAGKMQFCCHNCGASSRADWFIKTVDQGLFHEMQLERLMDGKTDQQIAQETFIKKMEPPKFRKQGPLKSLKKISQLSPDNAFKKFVADRKIPNPCHAKMFYCPNFMAFTNELIPGKFDEAALKHDEGRILIPFFDADNNMFAYTGRNLSGRDPKYMMIVLDDSKPKIFGLDTVNLNKTTYVFEGPIDSMFIPNSIAVGGGEMISGLYGFEKKELILVYDNEPRSKETKKKLDKAILNGYNVVIWPDNLEHKDINDMVKAGLSPEFITHILKQHTYKDLAAKLALNKWSKT